MPFETFKNIRTLDFLNINAGLADSFQLASQWCIISIIDNTLPCIHTLHGHNFARMPATTHVSNHTRFEIAVPFRMCSKPLPHEELRKNLEDPPE